jgi:hypothetical protein
MTAFPGIVPIADGAHGTLSGETAPEAFYALLAEQRRANQTGAQRLRLAQWLPPPPPIAAARGLTAVPGATAPLGAVGALGAWQSAPSTYGAVADDGRAAYRCLVLERIVKGEPLTTFPLGFVSLEPGTAQEYQGCGLKPTKDLDEPSEGFITPPLPEPAKVPAGAPAELEPRAGKGDFIPPPLPEVTAGFPAAEPEGPTVFETRGADEREKRTLEGLIRAWNEHIQKHPDNAELVAQRQKWIAAKEKRLDQLNEKLAAAPSQTVRVRAKKDPDDWRRTAIASREQERARLEERIAAERAKPASQQDAKAIRLWEKGIKNANRTVRNHLATIARHLGNKS